MVKEIAKVLVFAKLVECITIKCVKLHSDLWILLVY